jgi:hypothetical protein
MIEMERLTREEKRAFRKTGRIGGKKRAAQMTAEERKALARKAAQERWKKKKGN